MGNTLTGGRGTEEKKTSDISIIANRKYDKYIEEANKDKAKHPNKADELSEFYRVICEIVEEINRQYGNTQINVPTKEKLKVAYDNNHQGGKLTREEFGKCVQHVIREAEFSGFGAKDSLIYLFGVPTTALLIKHTVMPRAVSNDYFIAGVTSATALVLAKLNKI
ncbi:hypothetical protein ABKV19_010337 [Rosa sericea]